MQEWSTIVNHISACLGRNFNPSDRQGVGGGCINSAWCIRDDYNAFFVKLNAAEQLDMFAAEMEGLQALSQSRSVKVPEPVCYGSAGDSAYIVTEYLPIGGGYPAGELGEQLARMHRSTARQYGWHRDNTIGSTPQHNQWSDDWCEFWRTQRLGYQYSLAAENGYTGELQSLGERLLDRLDGFFESYTPAASLLHGDLWSGNVGGADGVPVIFDPAVYYGDRETDLAMTELFGRFPRGFYEAYNRTWPLDAGYRLRRDLYNLYHILNHANLFGGMYASEATRLTQRLLAEVS